ncbi:hypothetical protein Tco_0872036 [Tanacetum coccineum]
MTGPNTTPITPLSEQLYLVMDHHLLTRVPDKLDLDNWNYELWAYFFEQLCSSYDVDKYLHTPTTESTPSFSAPLTPEELKIDKIVLSWILSPFSDPFRAFGLVVGDKLAKRHFGGDLFSDIVIHNKQYVLIHLKVELSFHQAGDQSHEMYFQKD